MVQMSLTLRFAHVCALLQKLYHVAGVEGKPVVFLLTDTQISKESFLEDVNNLLNTGDVPGMFAADDKERILGSIKDWLIAQGAPSNKVTCPHHLATLWFIAITTEHDLPSMYLTRSL